MPAITVNRPDLFPAGTTVNAYVDPGRGSGPVSGAPSGSSVTSGVVASNGGLTLSLAASTPYILYASSPDRYLRVMVPRVTATAGGAVTPYRPEDYGALRNGTTDDTAAINSCIAAAVAGCQADGTYYCEVQFSAGTYLLSSATTVGGATLGNAQSPVPIIVPESSPKVTLVLKGAGKASAMHWAQTTPLTMGTVLKSTLTGLSADGTYGAPSVIGSANAQVGNNGLAPWFSNLHVVIDGITVLKPQNPTLVSFDLRGCAQMTIEDAASMVNVAASSLVGNPGSNGLGIGLMCPAAGNNAICDIKSFTSEGDNAGVVISEHVAARRILCLYNDVAVFVDTSRNVATNHASTIQYLCAEGVNTVLSNDQVGGIAFGINIVVCDTEIVNSGTHIADANGSFRGDVNWHDYAGTTPRVSGAANLRIIDQVIARGAFTPSLPATTVASTPIFRDMALTVSGGTVTAIAVDGVAQGVTSGTVWVPSGKTFAITYSVAPTLRAVKL
jgi:hypothetical protein